MNSHHLVRRLLVGFALLGATIPLTAASSSASSAAAATAPAGVHASDGWVRWLPGTIPSAGYLMVSNESDKDVVLIGVTSPDYAMVHLHQSYTTPDGNSAMRMVGALRIPAHGHVVLAPGGYHLMLMRARKALKPGDTTSVVLRFEGGATLSVPLAVKPADYNG